jgi:hypothetical protein
MPQRIEIEKMRMERAADVALARAARELGLRMELRADNHRPAFIGSGGFWTEDEDGGPEYVTGWLCGDIVGGAPN